MVLACVPAVWFCSLDLHFWVLIIIEPYRVECKTTKWCVCILQPRIYLQMILPHILQFKVVSWTFHFGCHYCQTLQSGVWDNQVMCLQSATKDLFLNGPPTYLCILMSWTFLLGVIAAKHCQVECKTTKQCVCTPQLRPSENWHEGEMAKLRGIMALYVTQSCSKKCCFPHSSCLKRRWDLTLHGLKQCPCRPCLSCAFFKWRAGCGSLLVYCWSHWSCTCLHRNLQ